jgi:Zn-dependent protease with chaperone function
MEYKYLLGLDSKTYEHPADKSALQVLRGKTGFETVTNFFLNWAYIKWHIVSLQGSCFQISPESCEELYNQIKEVANTLDVHPLPKLYTEWEYGINGYTTGYNEDVLMVLKSGAVDLLTPEELRFVVGHEMGHVKSGHVLFHMMAQLFNVAISQLPIVGALAEPIRFALLYWDRMSEFTADRAGLLACQNLDVALNATVKMAGLPIKYFGTNVRDGFMKQAESFQLDLNNFTDKAIKTLTIATSTHPWTVMRAEQLIKWYNSGEYQAILDGTTASNCVWPDCQQPVPQNAEVCPHCGRPQSV